MDAKKEYEKYKLIWMLYHDYTLEDLIDELQKMKEESDPDTSLHSLFVDWESRCGFSSGIWHSYEEFLECEYKRLMDDMKDFK